MSSQYTKSNLLFAFILLAVLTLASQGYLVSLRNKLKDTVDAEIQNLQNFNSSNKTMIDGFNKDQHTNGGNINSSSSNHDELEIQNALPSLSTKQEHQSMMTKTNTTEEDDDDDAFLFQGFHLIPSYPLKDLSNYSVASVGYLHQSSLSRNMKDSNCLFFHCSSDIAKCDNTLATNYDGPDQPCCVHVLRDMARIFDEEMKELELDYAVTFGTLLGLRRADKIIPWTADNDFLIPSRDVANAMVAGWDVKKTGLAHLHQGINRMCVTPDFYGGKLQKWSYHVDEDTAASVLLYNRGFPYIDFYVGEKRIFGRDEVFNEFAIGCKHLYRDVVPSRRAMFYNNSFALNIPANPEQILRTHYGRNWRVPKSDKDPHGTIEICSYGLNYRILRGSGPQHGPGPLRNIRGSQF